MIHFKDEVRYLRGNDANIANQIAKDAIKDIKESLERHDISGLTATVTFQGSVPLSIQREIAQTIREMRSKAKDLQNSAIHSIEQMKREIEGMIIGESV